MSSDVNWRGNEIWKVGDVFAVRRNDETIVVFMLVAKLNEETGVFISRFGIDIRYLEKKSYNTAISL